MNHVRGVGEGRGYICIPQSHTSCEQNMLMCFNNSRTLAIDLASKIHFRTSVASDGDLIKMVILLLLLLVPWCTGMCFLSLFCNIGLSLLMCDCVCSVSLPRSVVGRSVVCDCGITWSYSLVLILMTTLT